MKKNEQIYDFSKINMDEVVGIAEGHMIQCMKELESRDAELKETILQLGYDTKTLNPKPRVKLSKVANLLKSWNIEDVDSASIFSKCFTCINDIITKEENDLDIQILKEGIDYSLKTFESMEQRLETDLNYANIKIEEFKSEHGIDKNSLVDGERTGIAEQESLNESSSPQEHPCSNELKIYEKNIEVLKQIEKKDNELNEEIDKFLGLPVEIEEARKVVLAAKEEMENLVKMYRKLKKKFNEVPEIG